MLTTAALDRILAALASLKIGVLGDLFLDRYLDLDAALTEPSLETGLDAYQVARVRACPGAAGTVINNLAALGVGRIVPISMIGDDGEGYELRQALQSLPGIAGENLVMCAQRRTPTYTKPMLCHAGQAPRELNRLDIKNRQVLPAAVEAGLLERLSAAWPAVDVLLVLDQVSEPNCGVITGLVRGRLAEMGEKDPDKIVIADSRERIGLFRQVWLKPNERECLRAVGDSTGLSGAIITLARRTERPVFCTQGSLGMLVAESSNATPLHVPAYPVQGAIDPVGAGDSSSAALACALASGASPGEAAAFGNLIASITIQHLGTTGIATVAEVRARWRQVQARIEESPQS